MPVAIHFKKAETSITVAMCFIIINPGDKSNPVNGLTPALKTLLDSRLRSGMTDIRVYINQAN